ncbi:MAG: hypothetical protein ACRC6R_05395 [Bacteroidales bacterium]
MMLPPLDFVIDQLTIELIYRPSTFEKELGWRVVLSENSIKCNLDDIQVRDMRFRDVIWARQLMVIYQKALDVHFFDMRATYNSYFNTKLSDGVVNVNELYVAGNPAYCVIISVGDMKKKVWGYGGQPIGFDELVNLILLNITDPAEPIWAERKPSKCKRCGSTHIADVIYGVSDLEHELYKEIERGEIILADNLPTRVGPYWCCADCGTEILMSSKEEFKEPTS